MKNLKKFLPHLIAVGFFLLISVIYFSPILSGKGLYMSDVSNAKGMAKETDDFYKKTGTDPLWTGAAFSGMPTYQTSTHGKENFMSVVIAGLLDIFPFPLLVLWLNLIGFYILLVTMKVDYRLAIAGAIMYAFCSYTVQLIKVGHLSKGLALAFAPIALAGIIRTMKGKWLEGFIITMVGLAMQIYSNHFQITYYLLFVVIVFMIVELINALRTKQVSHYFKSCLVLAAAAIIGILPNITNLWSTYVYGKFTTRGPSELSSKSASTGLDIDYATAWSYGIEETLTLLIPDAKGGSSNHELSKSSATYAALNANGITGQQANNFIKNVPTYWGDVAFTAGPTYIGAIAVFLFVLGLFVIKGDMKWWLLIVTILSIMLAWGRNFMGFTEFFFYHVPGYNKFRAVSMTLVIASLAIPLLGMLAVKYISETKNNVAELQKKLKYAFYVTGGLCLVLFLIPSLAGNFEGRADEHLKQYDWLLTAIRQDRESMLRMSALFSFIYISITFAALWFFLKKKLKAEHLFYAILFFTIVDLWTTDKKYVNNDDFVSKTKVEKPFVASNADLQIMQDPDPSYRVLNIAADPFNDASTSYFHKSIGGYHGAKLKRYQELIENQIAKNNMNVLSMLNTRYFIVQSKESGELMVQRNPGALGNAWFVKEIKWVPNADSEMNALTDFNPAQTAVIDKRFEKEVAGFTPSGDSTASIHLLSYAPNDMIYESNSISKQFAVFSEIYYADGWNAYVDGTNSPYVRVNYVLRGMVVAEGKHKIEFKFEPASYHLTQTVSMSGSILIILIIAGYFVYTGRKKSDSPVA
jgi:hypothetical protein